jgi:dolichol-phosphate mannosyltransferase
MPDTQPYLRGAIAGLGFSQTGIPYERAARERGESKFRMADLIALSLDAILNHSIVPLRIASYVGITIGLLTLLGFVVFVIIKLLLGTDWPAGFATTTVLILVAISLNALFLGIMGEYLGRIYRQVKPRPITVIETSVSLRGRPPTRFDRPRRTRSSPRSRDQPPHACPAALASRSYSARSAATSRCAAVGS